VEAIAEVPQRYALSRVLSLSECPCAADFPRAWEIDASFELHQANENESDEEDDASGVEEEPKTQPAATPVARSPCFADFLQFLELGCGGSPMQGYPAIIVIISSIPSSVRAFLLSDLLLCNPGINSLQILLHSDSDIPASSFFSSFWAAVDGRALSALDRTTKSAAFLSALLECMVFVVRRVRSAREEADNEYGGDAEKVLVRDQYTKVWEECTSRRLRVEEGPAAELMAKSLVRLNAIDAGIHIPFNSNHKLKQCSLGRSFRCSMGRSRTWDDGRFRPCGHSEHPASLLLTQVFPYNVRGWDSSTFSFGQIISTNHGTSTRAQSGCAFIADTR